MFFVSDTATVVEVVGEVVVGVVGDVVEVVVEVEAPKVIVQVHLREPAKDNAHLDADVAGRTPIKPVGAVFGTTML